jgi:uncharacterized membrane protein HdeD (DUF308 family)
VQTVLAPIIYILLMILSLFGISALVIAPHGGLQNYRRPYRLSIFMIIFGTTLLMLKMILSPWVSIVLGLTLINAGYAAFIFAAAKPHQRARFAGVLGVAAGFCAFFLAEQHIGTPCYVEMAVPVIFAHILFCAISAYVFYTAGPGNRRMRHLAHLFAGCALIKIYSLYDVIAEFSCIDTLLTDPVQSISATTIAATLFAAHFWAMDVLRHRAEPT